MAEENPIMLEMLRQQSASIETLRRTIADGHESSGQSRAKLHERVDEVSTRLGKIETSIEIAGHVDAQVRTELDQMRAALKAHQDDTNPTIEAWSDMMRTGKRLSWIMGIAGLSFFGAIVAAVTWFGDAVSHLVKAWLKL